jgi:hypothetical protein
LGLVAALLLVPGCSDLDRESPVAPADDGALAAVDVEGLARAIVAEAGWPVEDTSGVSSDRAIPSFPNFQFERTVLAGDVAHYSLRVPVGPGEHDVIGLHRVVRERRPFVPIRTQHSIMLQHGDVKDFTGMFLPGTTSPTMPDGFGLAVTLAAADIDVWGIDQGWTLVPAETTVFDFMAGWGLDRQIRDLGTAIDLGRILRGLTGNGWRKMALLGYSSGSVTGFSLVCQDSQRPPGLRRVNAYVAGDFGLVSDHPEWIWVCETETPYYLDLIGQGIHHFESPFPVFGIPAREDPDGDSELIPGYTNLQAAIGIGAWTAYPEVSYHFLGGIFDEAWTPLGLQYTDVDMWLDFLISGPPYMPLQFFVDYESLTLAPESVPWDDHLADVTVPVFYLYATGGAGGYGLHTLDLIGSSDVTQLEIGFHPPEELLLDFAHVDLFIADDAPTLVFTPIRDWVLSHTP